MTTRPVTTRQHDILEAEIQRRILAELGAESDYLVIKNSVGVARHYDDKGKSWSVPYGLGVGSPDIVGMLRFDVVLDGITRTQRLAIWVCMEVKVPGEDATDEQARIHEVWRSFGALVDVVHSVDEARSALEGARSLLSLVGP